MRPMITNGGPHPADKWADVMTDAILDLIQVADDSQTEQAIEARQAKRDLRPVLFDIFNGHCDGVQRMEQSSLASIKKHAEAHAHAHSQLEQHPHVASALEEVCSALAATPFASHFAKPEVKAILERIIGQHSANVQHIERRYHADRLAKKES